MDVNAFTEEEGAGATLLEDAVELQEEEEEEAGVEGEQAVSDVVVAAMAAGVVDAMPPAAFATSASADASTLTELGESKLAPSVAQHSMHLGALQAAVAAVARDEDEASSLSSGWSSDSDDERAPAGGVSGGAPQRAAAANDGDEESDLDDGPQRMTEVPRTKHEVKVSGVRIGCRFVRLWTDTSVSIAGGAPRGARGCAAGA